MRYHKNFILSLLFVTMCLGWLLVVVSISACVRIQNKCIIANFFKGNCTFDCQNCSNKENIIFREENCEIYYYSCWRNCRVELENITTECYLDNLEEPKKMYLPNYDTVDKKFFENCATKFHKFMCYSIPLFLLLLIGSFVLIILVNKNKILVKQKEEEKLFINHEYWNRHNSFYG